MQNNADHYKTDAFITTKEAAEILSISIPTLRKYAQSGLIPIYRIGSKILFSKREVINAVIKRSTANMEEVG